MGASRLALLLNVLALFWHVAYLYPPSSRPNCLERLNCCCCISAAFCLEEASTSWAWVATSAGQISTFTAAKRVELVKHAVVGATTKTSPRLIAPNAASMGITLCRAGGADPQGRRATRVSRAPWLLDEEGAESTSEDGLVDDGDSSGAVIESNVPRCSWLCQNCRSVTCWDARGREDDLHICCSCYARYLGVPEEPSSVSCGTSKGNSHNWT